MINVLITGGAGFIPSSLAEGLLKDPNVKVVIVDNLLTGKESNIPKNTHCTFIKANVNNYKEIASIICSTKFDYIFHYAAVVGVKRTLDNPIMVLDDIEGIRNILDLAKNTGVKRLFFSSSSEVYGEPVEFPQNELTTPLNSKLPYAIVKNVGEAYVKSFYQEHGLEYTIFRFFNTYGPKQSSDFVMSKFIKAALNNQDITIYGDGSQTRTFCFIDDNIEATLKCLYENKYVNEVINLGSNLETRIIDLAEIIIKATHSKSKIVHLPALKEGDMTRRQPDNTKMLQLLNKNLITLEEGIKRILDAKNIK